MIPRDPGDWTPLLKAQEKRKTNPLDYLDGKALGRELKRTTWPQHPSLGVTGPPIVIPNPKRRR